MKQQKPLGILVCHGCGVRRRDLMKRLPRGWKRHSEFAYCEVCWSKLFLLRTITLPVASPLDCGWKELGGLLHEMWAATTQASNWLMSELYCRDAKRTDESRMPAMRKLYLYPQARERFPVLPPQSIAALIQKVMRTYRSLRYETVWTCARSLPVYHYPAPFLVPSSAWAIHEEHKAPVVSVRIGARRVRLRLKSGARYRRPLEAISKGDTVRGELGVYKRADQIICKIVAWFPRDPIQHDRSGVLTVRTSSDAVIAALNSKDERIWTYNGDQVRRWNAEYRAQLQRWSEDTKAEHRPTPPFADRRANAARKYRNRMRTACHTIASIVVNYAVRRRFAKLRYDDSDQTYCEQFPWFELKSRIIEKCQAAGLSFEEVRLEA